jgi:hypothetical protein
MDDDRSWKLELRSLRLEAEAVWKEWNRDLEAGRAAAFRCSPDLFRRMLGAVNYLSAEAERKAERKEAHGTAEL